MNKQTLSLLSAIENGDLTAVVQVLLRSPDLLSARKDQKSTPLQLAASWADSDDDDPERILILKQLIRATASIEGSDRAQSIEVIRYVLRAAGRQRPEVLHCFEEEGIDIHQSLSNEVVSSHILWHAVAALNEPLMAYLVKCPEVRQGLSQGVESDRFSGISLELMDQLSAGQTLSSSHRARQDMSVEVIKMLTESGMDWNVAPATGPDKGCRPLFKVMELIHYDGSKSRQLVLKALIECGADVNLKNEQGVGLLQWAVNHGVSKSDLHFLKEQVALKEKQCLQKELPTTIGESRCKIKGRI